MNGRILFVDDEENILLAHARTFRKRFAFDTALGGREALYRLAHEGPYAVVVSDMRMPEMDGVELLEQVRRNHPEVVRVMLTGNSDQFTAMEAVNRGAIFRFATKPCEGEALARILLDALEQHRLLTIERDLLERTLKGAVMMLGELLSMLDPASFGRSQQVATLAVAIAGELEMQEAWMLEVAAVLAHIGIHTLPPSVVAKLQAGGFLTAVEREMCHRIPEIGSNLISCVPRLDEVANIVFYSQKNMNGTGFPNDDIRGGLIPLGARVLRVAADFVTLAGREGGDLEVLRSMEGRQAWYDLKVLQALRAVLEARGGLQQAPETRDIPFLDLRSGQRLAEDVVTLDGWVVLPRDTVVGRTHLEKLRNFHRLAGLREPLRVFAD
ncbi:HD domain-containing phosphohydrolase [Mesoterricola sediminis]|uniref:Response regulator receiver modulated metal-depenent phosphohydrolase n=1 Tax=Mesoterricola sediminis TaxID=2927980 RepID=A0AA48KCK2_9BACT|nr:HD domain-containing phosphohydrolase [Mesoterricola sediminis]BDU75427.1 response regulator receiver modulated metal-depenent phosphohydrolase [Mesoterricola sediminis]